MRLRPRPVPVYMEVWLDGGAESSDESLGEN